MNIDAIRGIADAVLYEGYMLYPYRPSSVKNRQRWTFGDLAPGQSLQGQFLAESAEAPEVSVTVRFLQEDTPREVGVGSFDRGLVELSTECLSPGLHRVTLLVKNISQGVLAATHAIAQSANGGFISLTDPPDCYREAAAQCVNQGVWPVLAGDAGSRNCILVSPIILYDYPQIAAQSPGDLFDGTEIDEILSLRILTLADQEKDEIRAADPRARRILERTESLSREQMMKLHGVLRNPRAFKRGDRVRLWPQKRSDIMDLALVGRVAEIESVEVDYEQRIHLAVVLDDDPGKDLGALRQPGHRFFFSPEEVEPLAS